MFRTGESGTISPASICGFSKNLIYQLAAEISNNKLIFPYLRRGGAPSATFSARRRLNLNRPQLMRLTTVTECYEINIIIH